MSQQATPDVLAPDSPPTDADSSVCAAQCLADSVPEDVWINILQCFQPPESVDDQYETCLQERLRDPEPDHLKSLFACRLLSKRYSILSAQVLFHYAELTSFKVYEKFSSTIRSSAQGQYPLGSLVRTLVLDFPERQLWGTKADGSEPDGKVLLPAVGFPELLSYLTGLRSLGSNSHTLISPNFFSAVVFRASSASLPLRSLYGVGMTATNTTSFVLALGSVRSTLAWIRLVPSTEESSRFPTHLVPRYVFPQIHTIILDNPIGRPEDDPSNFRLECAHQLFAQWSFPALRSYRIESGLGPEDGDFPDPTSFLLKNGANIEDFGCSVSMDEDALILYLTSLPAVIGLTVRPFELQHGGVAQECLGRLRTLVVLFDEEQYDRTGWVDSFFAVIGRTHMPLLQHVVWDSLAANDEESAVSCWKKMSRFEKRLVEEGVKFTWV